MIKAHQLIPYDSASKRIEQAAQLLEGTNVAGLNEIDQKWLADIVVEVRRMRHEFFRKAHERFIAERTGDVAPGK